MKKFVLVTLLVVSSAAVYAVTETLATVIDIRPTSVHLSPDSITVWRDFKAEQFGLAAKEFEAMAQSIDDSDVRDEYKDLAEDLEELAEDLKALPVPKAGVQKTMEYIPEWRKLRARKKELVREHVPQEIISAVRGPDTEE